MCQIDIKVEKTTWQIHISHRVLAIWIFYRSVCVLPLARNATGRVRSPLFLQGPVYFFVSLGVTAFAVGLYLFHLSLKTLTAFTRATIQLQI